jgi:hypothetical protein
MLNMSYLKFATLQISYLETSIYGIYETIKKKKNIVLKVLVGKQKPP